MLDQAGLDRTHAATARGQQKCSAVPGLNETRPHSHSPQWTTSIVARAGPQGRAKRAAVPASQVPTRTRPGVSLLQITPINDIPRMSHRVTTRTMSTHVQRVSVPLYRALPSAARWCWGQSPETKKGLCAARSPPHTNTHTLHSSSIPLSSPPSSSLAPLSPLPRPHTPTTHPHSHKPTMQVVRPPRPPLTLPSPSSSSGSSPPSSLLPPHSVPPPPRQAAAAPHARPSHLPRPHSSLVRLRHPRVDAHPPPAAHPAVARPLRRAPGPRHLQAPGQPLPPPRLLLLLLLNVPPPPLPRPARCHLRPNGLVRSAGVGRGWCCCLGRTAR